MWSLLTVIRPREQPQYDDDDDEQEFDLVPDAIDALTAVGDFNGALVLANERAPDLLERVERAQQESLNGPGRWGRIFPLLARPENQVGQYILLHVQSLLQRHSRKEAVAVLAEQGLPKTDDAIAVLLELAQAVICDAMAFLPDFSGRGRGYDDLQCHSPAATGGAEDLKRVLAMAADSIGASHPDRARIEQLGFVAHLLAVLAQAEAAGLKYIVAKISVALLRYAGDVPTDIAFYRAGWACMLSEWNEMAFIFFLRYVDVCDMMEDPEHLKINNSDFLSSDIPCPSKSTLPERPPYSADEREPIREMLFDIAMSSRNGHMLTQRTCSSCSAPTYVATLVCHRCRKALPPCRITGWPVLESNQVESPCCHRPANLNDWNSFVKKLKVCPWCGSSASAKTRRRR